MKLLYSFKNGDYVGREYVVTMTDDEWKFITNADPQIGTDAMVTDNKSAERKLRRWHEQVSAMLDEGKAR
jgi:hypothetical protein